MNWNSDTIRNWLLTICTVVVLFVGGAIGLAPLRIEAWVGDVAQRVVNQQLGPTITELRVLRNDVNRLDTSIRSLQQSIEQSMIREIERRSE